MKKLLIIAILMLTAAVCMAAQQYYGFPTVNTLRDDARVLIYSNLSSKNITGLTLKQEISAFAHLSASRRIANANQIFDLMTTASSKKLIKRAPSDATTYQRIMEIKDSTGKIVYWINNSGQMIFGTPLPLAVTGVYPSNGATNVSNGTWFNYSSTDGGYNYWARRDGTTPYISYNKPVSVTISTQYIVGSSIAPSSGNSTPAFSGFSGAAGTTYTMRSIRQSIIQQDGETTSSCGTAMTDIAGYCQSTFTMK